MNRRANNHSGKDDNQMWGIFAGITAFIILLQIAEEWRLRRDDKKRLDDMREHFGKGHRWDALKGRWVDH